MTEHPEPSAEERRLTLAVLVPLLRRVHHIAPMLASLEETTPVDHVVIAIASPGDRPVIDAVELAARDLPAGRLRLEIVAPAHAYRGDYARKINHAARVAIDELHAEALFLGADDLRFRPDWWIEAIGIAGATGAAVIGTNDLGSPRVIRGEHSTHSLVSADYVDELGTIDEPGKVLHEGYPHEYVDDEFIATAKFRGLYAHADRSHVEHLHPNWGKAPMDELYRAQRRRMEAGRPLFRRRSALWNA